MLIGVTGTLASGKDTISEYLKGQGFFHFSLADVIREECERRGLPKDRDTLRNLGNELRETLGADILARRAIMAIQKQNAQSAVITSIRNPEEVKFLKQQPNFVLIAIDAPVEIRYQWIVPRKRESDFVDFETFKRQENEEMAGGEFKQNLKDVIAMADYKIINDGTQKELYQKIGDILKKYENQNKKN